MPASKPSADALPPGATVVSHPVAPAAPSFRPASAQLVRRLGGLARRAAWHVLHPSAREPCLEGPVPPPLVRLYYTASDGWRAPLRVLPSVPGGSGEPVVLAHALGIGGDAFRYGSGPTLASRLSQAGFSVYLLAHRGDADAIAPGSGAGFDFDDILERDVPAALARVREHSGFPLVHWVGHGMGGQLGMAWASHATDHLASVVALCAPAAFRGRAMRSEARSLARAAALLPVHWRVPARALASASVPWVGADAAVFGQVSGGTSRVRGVLAHAAEDLPVGLLRQMDRWASRGAWTDRTGRLDRAEALADAVAPLLVIAAEGDELCPPECALVAVERWGGADRTHVVLPTGWGHLDPILAVDADRAVAQPLVAWLRERRRAAWERDPLG